MQELLGDEDPIIQQLMDRARRVIDAVSRYLKTSPDQQSSSSAETGVVPDYGSEITWSANALTIRVPGTISIRARKTPDGAA